VVPPGGSAHILQNDRLSACSTSRLLHPQVRGSGNKLRSDHYLNYQHRSNTLTTVQSLLHHITPMPILMERKERNVVRTSATRTSSSTAHGAQVIGPLDYMGRSFVTDAVKSFFFETGHIGMIFGQKRQLVSSSEP